MGKTVDLSRMEFRVMLEMKLDSAKAARALQGLGWDVQERFYDCSHGDEPDFAYIRVKSPSLTLAQGGGDQIANVVSRLKQQDADPGRSGAIRIYVNRNLLDKKGEENLLSMHLAHEAILYRIAMGGGKGRTIDHKDAYARPLSHYTTKLARHEFPLDNSHLGLNKSAPGVWEFRYFDSSLDPAVVQADVRLVLGMVKAAAEGRGEWKEKDVESVLNGFGKPVSWKKWNAFLDVVLGDDPVRKQIEAQFKASGGKFDWQPVHLGQDGDKGASKPADEARDKLPAQQEAPGPSGLLSWAKRALARVTRSGGS